MSMWGFNSGNASWAVLASSPTCARSWAKAAQVWVENEQTTSNKQWNTRGWTCERNVGGGHSVSGQYQYLQVPSVKAWVLSMVCTCVRRKRVKCILPYHKARCRPIATGIWEPWEHSIKQTAITVTITFTTTIIILILILILILTITTMTTNINYTSYSWPCSASPWLIHGRKFLIQGASRSLQCPPNLPGVQCWSLPLPAPHWIQSWATKKGDKVKVAIPWYPRQVSDLMVISWA